MGKSLTHNGINTRAVLINEVRCAAGKVMVASPASGQEVESVADVWLRTNMSPRPFSSSDFYAAFSSGVTSSP